jgi:hypothetical protein
VLSPRPCVKPSSRKRKLSACLGRIENQWLCTFQSTTLESWQSEGFGQRVCVWHTHTHPFKNTPFCCTFYSKACAFHLDLGTVTGSWWQMCMSLSIWETPQLTCQVLLWHSGSLRFASASRSHTAGSPHTKLSKEAREKGFAPEIAKASVATICSKTTVSQSIQNLKGWNAEALY